MSHVGPAEGRDTVKLQSSDPQPQGTVLDHTEVSLDSKSLGALGMTIGREKSPPLDSDRPRDYCGRMVVGSLVRLSSTDP